MDRRFLTVLGVSLVFALVVSSVFYQFTARSSPGGAAAPRAQETDIVLATRPLGVGVMVRPADVKLGKVAATAFPKGAFSKVEDVLDRPVISNILLDEAILDGRLAVKGSGLGLAPTIPVGMRAVTIRVNDVGGVAGFVLPGMHVDVLITGRPPNGGDENMTSTVLQNMQVLSAGQRMEADAGGKPMQTPTVTLLATPDQSETLTLSNNEGRIQLVLRNSSDQEIANTAGSTSTELYGGTKRRRAQQQAEAAPAPAPAAHPRPRPAPAPVAVSVALPPPPPPPPAAPPEIVVIRGTTRTIEVVAPAKVQVN